MTAMAEQPETTVHEVVAPPVPQTKRYVVAGINIGFGVLLALMLTVWKGDADSTGFGFGASTDWFTIPTLWINTWVGLVLFALPLIGIGVLRLVRVVVEPLSTVLTVAAVVCGIVCFLLWVGTVDPDTTLDVTGLLQDTLFLAVPLILGALAGVVSERSGVINLAIEGQILGGAFASALVASVAGSLVAGLIGGMVAGLLVGALLAVFAIIYRVDQVVLGVVINLFILGLTTYLYSALMQTDAAKYNNPPTFEVVKIPGLSGIPVLGPLLFNQNLTVYLALIVLVGVHVMLKSSRWGLRTRAIGEHPKAADTVGINVNRMRFTNSLVAGAIGGLAGVYLTIGTVGEFGANMSAGRGFIALAAVIFGRWTPLGSAGAALLFAFATSIKTLLSIVGAPIEIDGNFLEMLPYVVTVVIVAGAIGRVRAPAADGVPYVKS
jgi:ABC-type uncharacterized transport system permease subunit